MVIRKESGQYGLQRKCINCVFVLACQFEHPMIFIFKIGSKKIDGTIDKVIRSNYTIDPRIFSKVDSDLMDQTIYYIFG